MNVALHIAMHAAVEENRLLARLREGGATSPRSAIPLPLSSSFQESRLKGLIRRGVVAESQPGQYFVDEEVAAARAEA